MNATVFHFTDTIRLPWILAARQLNPTRGMAAADYPRPTFLWATTDERGDRTAASASDNSYKAWRQGRTLYVKFVLAAEDFTPWTDMYPRHTQWTPEKIARVELNGRKKGSRRSAGCAERNRSRCGNGSVSRRDRIAGLGSPLTSPRTQPLKWTQPAGPPARFEYSISRSMKSMRPASRSTDASTYRSA
jgi:hypothetical protein